MLTGNIRLVGRRAMSNVFQIRGFVIILPVALKYSLYHIICKK